MRGEVFAEFINHHRFVIGPVADAYQVYPPASTILHAVAYVKCAAFRKGSFFGSLEIYPPQRGKPQNMDGSLRAGGVFSLLQGAGMRMLMLQPTNARVCRAMKTA